MRAVKKLTTSFVYLFIFFYFVLSCALQNLFRHYSVTVTDTEREGFFFSLSLSFPIGSGAHIGNGTTSCAVEREIGRSDACYPLHVLKFKSQKKKNGTHDTNPRPRPRPRPPTQIKTTHHSLITLNSIFVSVSLQHHSLHYCTFQFPLTALNSTQHNTNTLSSFNFNSISPFLH